MKAKRFLLLLVALLTLASNGYGQNSLGKVFNAGLNAILSTKKDKKGKRQIEVPDQIKNFSYNRNEQVTSKNKENENSVLLSSSVTEKSASQSTLDDVTIVVTGDGVNKEEATRVALRSAIEQVYGTFVSSNTALLNDELVKDEIVTIATGNIKSYQELNSVSFANKTSVTLKATVSRSKLVRYAQAKGASTEFAGATFGANMKLKELNRKNELTVLNHLKDLVFAAMPNCYSLECQIGEPTVTKSDWGENSQTYDVPLKVFFVANSNAQQLDEMFWGTWNSLVLKDEEVAEYKRLNMQVSECHLNDNDFYLRNDYGVLRNFENALLTAAVYQLFNFKIEDNLGNVSYFKPKIDLGSDNFFNVSSVGGAIIEPWSGDGINWMQIDKIIDNGFFCHDFWVSWFSSSGPIVSRIIFNRGFVLPLVLRIFQEDISKISSFKVERKTENLNDFLKIK